MPMIEVSKKVYSSEIAVLSAVFTKDPTGVAITLTSKEFEDFFESLSQGAPEPVRVSKKWGGVKFYEIAKEPPVLQDASFCSPGEPLMLDNGIINLSMLRLVGLRNGVTVVIPGLYPESVFRAYKKCFVEQVQRFWADYLKPSSESHELTSKRILE